MQLVSREKISKLPVPAAVALAAHSARQLQKLLENVEDYYPHRSLHTTEWENDQLILKSTIVFAEQVAALKCFHQSRDQIAQLKSRMGASSRSLAKAIKEARKDYSIQPRPGPGDTCMWWEYMLNDDVRNVEMAANTHRAYKATYWAYKAAVAQIDQQSELANRATLISVQTATGIENKIRNRTPWYTRFEEFDNSLIVDDLNTLFDISKREHWSDTTPVFASFFTPDADIERTVMLAINDLCVKLCEIVAYNKNALRIIDWRQLEQVIATALKGIGFDVELTRSSKDGGKDVIATCLLKGRKVTYYIEVKHWLSKQVNSREIARFIEVNVQDLTDGGLFLSTSGFAPKIFRQLSEITNKRICLGNDSKIFSLCQHFVQRRGRAVWESSEVLPQILFGGTISL